MAAVTAGTRRAGPADGPGVRGPSPARTAGPAAANRSRATMRSWPLLVLAAPAAAEVWSGWVGIAQKTGFGLVSPLPGIWPSLHLDTSITLPVGVEAYAAYALRAWLASEHAVSARTRRFAKWSAIFSFTLGMAGQVAYHLLAQAGAARAPWAITTIVSCLPVLVLAMGTTLAHMLRADAATTDGQDIGTAGPSVLQSPAWSPRDQAGPDQHQDQDGSDQTRTRPKQAGPGLDQAARGGTPDRAGRQAGTRMTPHWDAPAAAGNTGRAPRSARPETDQARLIARRLAASGNPVSRRALRSNGARGSNETLNALAHEANTELAAHSSAAHAAERRSRTLRSGGSPVTCTHCTRAEGGRPC